MGPSGCPTVVLSEKKYNRLRQYEFFQNNQSTTHASFSGMSVYNASPQRPWILDSGASSHMTGIKQNLFH